MARRDMPCLDLLCLTFCKPVAIGCVVGLLFAPGLLAQAPASQGDATEVQAGETAGDETAGNETEASDTAEQVSPQLTAVDAFDRASVSSPFDVAPVLFQARRLRGLTGEVATLVLRGEPGGNFSIEALATPLPAAAGEKAEVPLFIEVDGSSFMDMNRSKKTRVEIYAYALAGTDVVDYLADIFVVDTEELGEVVWQSGLKFYGHLRLPPGDYTLRVLVRNFQSEAAALRELSLTVPDPAAGAGSPLAVFPGPTSRDAWMPIREWRTEGPMTEATYPFVADNEPVSPAARPVLVAGRTTRAFLFLPQPIGDSAVGRIELLAGKSVTTVSLDSVDACSGRQDGPACLVIQFTAPAAEPGAYRLRAILGSAAAGIASAELPVMVLSDRVREPDLLWTDLRWLVSGEDAVETDRTAAKQAVGPAAPMAAENAPKRAERRRLRKLADQYRQALSLLQQGSEAGTRSAILDLESQVLQESSRGTVGSLRIAEMSVIAELADSDVESLLPVLMVHDSLYRTYRQRGIFSLVSHTRAMVEQIAVTYAERGGSEGSRVTAGRALASLGGYLQEANLPASSRRLFELALTYDPRNEAALVGLAASFEKYGEYLEASHYLERLAESSPRFGEGLLRLAVNLRRMGDKTRADELLQKATTGRSPTWVQILARQEIARGQIETGRLEAAVETLEEAARLAPQQNSTKVLLAYVYDRLGRIRQAAETTEGLAASKEASARHTYDTWPTYSLESSRTALGKAAQARAATLGNVLSATEGDSP